MENDDVIRVYVGVDRSQLLAVPVLEYSIKRHTTARVEVIPMLDLPVPEPKDPRNGQRTGFSFSRFCIPKLAGYEGKAIYMDADMLVFQDIRKLWKLPFNGAKILIQEEVKFADVTMAKENAPKERKKQCAVMLLDCARLDWDVNEIVQGMDDGRYSYDQLMSGLCILPEREVGYGVPFEWNSLEHYDSGTCLIHYTDMGTQPWASTRNSNGYLWFDEVRRMLKAGVLGFDQIMDEIAHGYFRPSLCREIRYGHLIPKSFRSLFNEWNEAYDKRCGYVPHKSVYDQKRIRNKAIKEYERSISSVKT
ncbi:glycosyltransferase [Pseudomonas alliivorans]|nr:glycosyltransferase [Pseudomonas alliivorans]MEE4947419.1 glycosyltransferase [Pseudomonas alliivorans]MEE5134943.1 glycosyltransferase [Pseudomonas alliivorans]MEE5153477.1 glycosyltransferase [Pseudomonas alliivorans]